jgi:hypothetical protein
VSREGLDALRARVHADPELARRLYRVPDDRFADELSRIAAAAGCEVDAGDVRAALAQARTSWGLRWVR